MIPKSIKMDYVKNRRFWKEKEMKLRNEARCKKN